jgi:hypothetical protein
MVFHFNLTFHQQRLLPFDPRDRVAQMIQTFKKQDHDQDLRVDQVQYVSTSDPGESEDDVAETRNRLIRTEAPWTTFFVVGCWSNDIDKPYE